MSLPLEVREIIYDALWRLEPIRRVGYNGDMVKLHYDDIGTEESPCRDGLPRWLLVNKAFLLEGMIQLDSKTMWVCEPARHNVPTFSALSRPKQGNSYGDDARPNTQFLDLSKARRVMVRTLDPIFSPTSELDAPMCDKLRIRRILGTGLRVRVLRFSSTLRGRYGTLIPPQNLTLEWLEHFRPRPRVDRFEYEISGVENLFKLNPQVAPPFFPDRPAWPQMQGKFEKEVERVGRLLVGGDGTFEAKLLKTWFKVYGSWRPEWTCTMTYTRKNKK